MKIVKIPMIKNINTGVYHFAHPKRKTGEYWWTDCDKCIFFLLTKYWKSYELIEVDPTTVKICKKCLKKSIG